MLDDALKTAMNAPHEAALRFALWMIAIALLMMLAVRLAMSVVSIVRVKARRDWMVQPPVGKEQSLLSRLLTGDVDESMQGTLFTAEVRQMLAQAPTGKGRKTEDSRSH